MIKVILNNKWMLRWSVLLAYSSVSFAGYATLEEGPLNYSQDLEWDSREIEVVHQSKQHGEEGFVNISGKFFLKGWTLLLGEKPLDLKPISSGSKRPYSHFQFQMSSPSTGAPNRLMGVSPEGETRSFDFILTQEKEKSEAVVESTMSTFALDSGLSLIYFLQRNSNGSSISHRVGQPNLRLSWNSGYKHSRIAFLSDIFLSAGTLIQFSSASVDLTFLNGNLTAAYSIPWLKTPWQLEALAGVSYKTTFTTSLAGYAHLYGPHVTLQMGRHLRKGDALSISFKFSPFLNGLSFLSSPNHEFLGRISYSLRPQALGQVLSFYVETSGLVFQSSGLGSIEVDILSLNMKYSL